jgi:hypothetical protein
MSLTITGTPHRTPGAILPMSWLDWSQDGDDYVGGDYRVRLRRPFCWEVLLRGKHLFSAPGLHAALVGADRHHRERLRAHDLTAWGVVLAFSVLTVALVEIVGDRAGLWSVALLGTALYAGISALVRLYAAFTRSSFDPYRRPAPWESRHRWRR